jgi:transcriptional pleiotropic regulator of transition state genes
MKTYVKLRKVDVLGRIVIPKFFRWELKINSNDEIEILVNDEQIIFKKYKPPCVLCENVDDGITFLGKRICKECLTELTK